MNNAKFIKNVACVRCRENGKDKHIWNGTFYHGLFGVNPAVDEFCDKFGYNLTITSEWFGTWMIKKN